VTPRGVSLLLAAALVAAASPAGAQTWRTLTSARQRHGEIALTVHVNYAVGEFRLAKSASGTLYRMDLRYDERRFAPVRAYDPDESLLVVGLRALSRGVEFSRTSGALAPSLELALSPDIPLALDLDLGAARSRVDLGGLAYRRVRLRTGASETEVHVSRPNPGPCDELRLEAGAATLRAWNLGDTNCRKVRFEGGVGEVTLDFSGSWREAMEAELTVALGSLTLLLPRDAGVAVRMSRFLASFERKGFVRRGDVYYSSGYDQAERRLTLDVRATFGGVDVVWTGGR
jgi:hypothetical protein